ncbi:VPLPA-CTERM sorting domain-containing protein [Methylobacter sp. YRD-M1]|uniref:VPLPA-CTERM sorting domain-containing protein n=1 Tax=Methylobacter sp. YRD-M1 TaxID=2911520 RepID=UPI00227B35C0|nr:VPLPA-CTERM sorting domain-containing protein [Methylobacter sp. YRD-M1]WAK02475.1 VPLPA-CTERM sorting domain-containing protein [Methylobacter sp. YRD-M1]
MKKQDYLLGTAVLALASFAQSASAATVTYYANGSDTDTSSYVTGSGYGYYPVSQTGYYPVTQTYSYWVSTGFGGGYYETGTYTYYQSYTYTYNQYYSWDAINKEVSIDYTLGSDWTINSAKFWVKAADDSSSDASETAQITKIENNSGIFGETVISGDGWYFGLDIMDYLLSPYTNPFTATISALPFSDFIYKNAKIEIDYTVNPPSQVPVPAAVWLFGSGLVGLLGFNRKRAQSAA